MKRSTSRKSLDEEINTGGGMRLGIDKLLDDNKLIVDNLRIRTQDVLSRDPASYDDIFLLRYALTHRHRGGIEAAEDAVRKTIEWRTENAAILEKVASTGKAPHEDVVLRFSTFGYVCDLSGYEPVWVARTGHCNQRALMSTLTIDQVGDWLHYSKEVFWRICDERTRKTRTLIKVFFITTHRCLFAFTIITPQMITVVDFDGLSLFGGDSRFNRALGKSSEMSALYYPQVLATFLITAVHA